MKLDLEFYLPESIGPAYRKPRGVITEFFASEDAKEVYVNILGESSCRVAKVNAFFPSSGKPILLMEDFSTVFGICYEIIDIRFEFYESVHDFMKKEENRIFCKDYAQKKHVCDYLSNSDSRPAKNNMFVSYSGFDRYEDFETASKFILFAEFCEITKTPMR